MNNFDNYLNRIIEFSPTKEELVENIKILFEIEHTKRLESMQISTNIVEDILDDIAEELETLPKQTYYDLKDEEVDCYDEDDVDEVIGYVRSLRTSDYEIDIPNVHSYELQLENRLVQQENRLYENYL
jgi:hypothetical protein